MTSQFEEEAMERIRIYESMDISEKVETMNDLRSKKKELERQLGEVDVDLIMLNRMPDVARYKVEQNDSVKVLLNKLRDIGDISYSTLIKDFDSGDKTIVCFYLHLLKTAEYIQIDSSGVDEEIRIL
jgi:hypothetical protein